MLATPCEAALLRAHAQLRPIAPAPSSSPQRSEKALGGASATAPPSSGSSTPAAVSGSGGGGGGESCLCVHWVAVFQALRARRVNRRPRRRWPRELEPQRRARDPARPTHTWGSVGAAVVAVAGPREPGVVSAPLPLIYVGCLD
jgi:hypothetical protein